jgi:hypothetical protein
MAITQDGSQLFGFTTDTFKSMIVESFTLSTPANRVDLDDGDGEPLGATIVPQRVEASLTVQVGAAQAPPTIGESVTYGSYTILVTSVDLTESQADYQRYSISGYEQTNP